MNYLLMELDWIKMLPVNYNVPVELLTEYWQIYHQALVRNLNERRSPILRWDEDILNL